MFVSTLMRTISFIHFMCGKRPVGTLPYSIMIFRCVSLTLTLFSPEACFLSSRNLILLLGGLGRVHRQGVHESTGNGNGRSDDGTGGHGGLEGDDGRDDNDNALDRVAHGMGHGVDLRGKEREL